MKTTKGKVGELEDSSGENIQNEATETQRGRKDGREGEREEAVRRNTHVTGALEGEGGGWSRSDL